METKIKSYKEYRKLYDAIWKCRLLLDKKLEWAMRAELDELLRQYLCSLEKKYPEYEERMLDYAVRSYKTKKTKETKNENTKRD